MRMCSGMIFKTDKDLNIILVDKNGESEWECDRLILFLNKFKSNQEYGEILGESYTSNNQYTIEGYTLEPNKRYKVDCVNYVGGSHYGYGTAIYKMVEVIN